MPKCHVISRFGMVDIGHELSHAIELLHEPTVVDGNAAHNFYQRSAAVERYNFETQAAIEIELKIDKELREWARRPGDHAGSSDDASVMR